MFYCYKPPNSKGLLVGLLITRPQAVNANLSSPKGNRKGAFSKKLEKICNAKSTFPVNIDVSA